MNKMTEIFIFVRDNPDCTVNEISDRMDISKNTVRAILDKLLCNGIVERRKDFSNCWNKTWDFKWRVKDGRQ